MELGLHKSFKILAPGSSLRRRVAYSLAVVRLILVPVIFLAVYYLFRMGLIVDRIVNVDAPVTTLAEQISVEMLDVRRAERSYFLLRDPQYLKANQEALAQVKEIARTIEHLAPNEQPVTAAVFENAKVYEQQFGNVASLAKEPGGTSRSAYLDPAKNELHVAAVTMAKSEMKDSMKNDNLKKDEMPH
jgi:hypothetical protein